MITKNKKNVVFSIVTSGLFLSMIILIAFLGDNFKFFGGYSIEFFFIVYVIGLMIINDKIVAFFYMFVTPWITLLIEGGISVVSFGQLVLEYFLSFYIFFPFLILKINKISTKNFWLKFILIILLYILCWFGKFIIHFIAGYIWWTPGSFWGSFSLNLFGVFLNGIMTVPIFCLLVPQIFLIQKIHEKNSNNSY